MSCLVASALLLLATGCQSLDQKPEPLSASAVRLELPLERQSGANDCGVAALISLCRHWGIELEPAARTALEEHAAANDGLSGTELCTALNERELETFLYRGTLDRSALGLYPQIDAGRPLLVMLERLDGSRHYVLVIGYDEPRENLILLDAQVGEILVPRVLFERDWSACAHFTLLAVPLHSATSKNLHTADTSTPSTPSTTSP